MEIIAEVTILWREELGIHTFTGIEENVAKFIKLEWPETTDEGVRAVIEQAKQNEATTKQ